MAPYGYSKVSDDWNDPIQDAIQINTPVEFIDSYDKYIVLYKNKKLKLQDHGNIYKNGIKYILKNYGVNLLNGNQIYTIFRSSISLNSNVDLTLLYRDKNIVAFRIRESSNIDYVKQPFRRFVVNTYIYDLTLNKYTVISVLNSEGEIDGSSIDSFQGDQLIHDKENYLYTANVKYFNSKKTSVLKVNLSKTLKCVASTDGCENIGYFSAEVK